MKLSKKMTALIATFLLVFGNIPVIALACHYTFQIVKTDNASPAITLSYNDVPNVRFEVSVLTFSNKDVLTNFATSSISDASWDASSDKKNFKLGDPISESFSGVKLIRIKETGSSTDYNVTAQAKYFYVVQDNKFPQPNGHGGYSDQAAPATISNGSVSLQYIPDDLSNAYQVSFVNNRNPGSLNIIKRITGVDGAFQSEKIFTFSLQYSPTGANANDFSAYGESKSVGVNETASWSSLPWGWYKISESFSINGYGTPTYDTSNGSNIVYIGKGNLSKTVTVTNTHPLGSVDVKKAIDGIRGAAIGRSFTFSLLKWNGTDFVNTDIAAQAVDNGGTASFSNLPWGQYKISEAAAPGYGIKDYSKTGGSASVSSDGVFAIDASHLSLAVTATNNKPTGSLSVTKAIVGLDANTRTGKSFKFHLDKITGSLVQSIGDITIDNGQSDGFSGLDWGNYKLTEVDLPDGYAFQSFSSGINADGTFNINQDALSFSVTATNSKPAGSVDITKSVEGVTGSINKSFTFTLQKWNGTAFEDIPGLTPKTIDNGGVASFSGLDWGKYQVVETSPTGYAIKAYSGDADSNGVFYVDAGHIHLSVTATNNKPLGSLAVTKSVNGVTGPLDKSFTFHLQKWDAGSSSYKDIPGLDDITIDNGQSKSFTGLEWGKYLLSEINLPAGYNFDSFNNGIGADHTFTVNQTKQSFSVTAKNNKPLGSIEIHKSLKDGGNTSIGKIFVFKLSKLNPSTGKYVLYKLSSAIDNGGSTTISDLPWGDYMIEEINIPGFPLVSIAGQGLTDGKFTVGVTQQAFVVNALNDTPKGKIVITKHVDGLLPNVPTDQAFVFQLQKKNAEGDYEDYGAPSTGVDNGGIVTFDSLPWGDYKITEVPNTNYPQKSIIGINVNSDGTFTVGLKQLIFGVIVTNDKPMGSVTIQKSVKDLGPDDTTGQSFVFNLKMKILNKYVTVKTSTALDNNGSYTFSNLPWGEYQIEEVAVTNYPLLSITGSGLNTTNYTFTIDKDQLSFTFNALNDKPLGHVDVTKAITGLGSDVQTGESFSFQLLKRNGEGEYVKYGDPSEGIDNGGVASFDKLDWGDYKITEVSVDGYPLHSITGANLGENNTFKVGPEALSFSFTATNDKPKGSISVVKHLEGLSEAETPSDAFTFTLYQKVEGAYQEVAHHSIGNGGTALFDNLDWGTYYLKETNVGTGYTFASLTSADDNTGLTDDGYLSFTVGASQQNFEATGTNRKLGSLKLTKSVDGAAKSDTAEFTFHLIDSSDNDVTSAHLPEGVDNKIANGETLEFINLPWDDYKITEDSIAGYISVSGTVPVMIGYNDQKQLVLNPEVTYENMKLPTIHILKLDSDTKKPVAKVTFEIERVDQPGLLAAIFGGQTWKVTTGDDGIAELATNELVPGKYLITEIEAPTGYVKAVAQSVTLEAGKTAEVTFYNDPQAFLQLLKTDADTGKALDGAEFKLSRTQDFKEFTTVAVGASGTQVTLVPGTWYVQETKSPTGYELNSSVFTATLKLGETTPLSVPDKLIVGSLRLIKVDAATYNTANEKHLAGALFNIYSDVALTKLAASGLTNGDGEINISKLVPGTYWVVEKQAPAGYDLSSNPVSVNITANTVTELKLLNTKTGTNDFNDEKALIRLLKVDGYSQKALQGAKFNLYSDSTLKTLVATGTTDINGLIEFKDLTPGTYYLVETKAPKGYKLNATPIAITTEAAKTSTITISNELDDTKDYQTGSMEYNILIGGGALLLLGGLLVLFTRRRKAAKSSKH